MLDRIDPPKAGDGFVICNHLDLETFAYAHVMQCNEDASLHEGELPHKYLFLCDGCLGVRQRDPAAPIAGLHYTWPKGLVLRLASPRGPRPARPVRGLTRRNQQRRLLSNR